MDQSWCRKLPACLLLLGVLLSSVPAIGDIVRTDDGQTHRGTVRIEGGRIVIAPVPPAQGDAAVEFARVREIIQQAEEADDDADDVMDDVTDDVDPAGLRGLRVEYFSDREMKQSKLVRIEPVISFGFGGNDTVNPRVGSQFSARWTGQLETGEAEWNADLAIEFSGTVRIWIDNKLVVERVDSPVKAKFSVPLKLAANRKHAFRCEYSFFGARGGATLRVGMPARGRTGPMFYRLFTPPEGVVAPAMQIMSPAHEENLVAPASVHFEAAAESRHGIKEVRWYLGDRLIKTQQAGPWKWEWDKPKAGYHQLWVEADDDQGVTSLPRWIHFVVSGNGGGTLPEGWTEMPFGVNVPVGSTKFGDGLFTLEATAGEMWRKSSHFHFVTHPMTGDGAIVARLVSIGPEAATTSGGLMLRPYLGKPIPSFEEGYSQRDVGAAISISERVVFIGMASMQMVEMRHVQGTTGKRDSKVMQAKPPRWLKLVRHGNIVKSYHSEDGQSWALLNARAINLPETIHVGMSLIGSLKTPSQAVFSDVSITAGSPALESTVTGVTLRDGSIIAGVIRSTDGTTVHLMRGGEQVDIPQRDVARVMLTPMSSEAAARLGQRTGVLMANGDFLEGTVSNMKGPSFTIDSLLFGERRFKAASGVTAVVLAEVETREKKYTILTANGSLLRSDSVKAEGDRLKVGDVRGMSFELPIAELRELRVGGKKKVE